MNWSRDSRPSRLREAVRPRLRDLGGADAGCLLRLVEAYATPGSLREAGRGALGQPDLAPERAWEALSLLDGMGVLADYPELVERWDELNEMLDDEGSLEQLAEQLESDPDEVWLALQGLGGSSPTSAPKS